MVFSEQSSQPESKLQQTVVAHWVVGDHLASVGGAASVSRTTEVLHNAKSAPPRYEEHLKKQH